jgi:hypothetical protein
MRVRKKTQTGWTMGVALFSATKNSASLEELKASFTVAEFPKPGSVTTGVE